MAPVRAGQHPLRTPLPELARAEPGQEGRSAAISPSAGPAAEPTLVRTFAAMMAREVRVLRRKLKLTVARVVMQPLLFVFVFTYVLPKTGRGSFAGHGGITFATILVPGLVASTMLIQGITAVSIPLLAELSWERTIEDRVLAPLPVRMLALQKIMAGAMQALFCCSSTPAAKPRT
jgi:hypothetical protein